MKFQPDPIARFLTEYEEAAAAESNDHTAFALATATPDGHPSVRYMLLKEAGPRGFLFFTNRESRKAADFLANPHASMLFFYPALYRQIRIEGRIEFASDSESDAYFASRARESQIGAWASLQSQNLPSRADFDARFEQFEKQFEGRDVPRPPHWGGQWLVPATIEFWYGRDHRLHDREVYSRRPDGAWDYRRLYP